MNAHDFTFGKAPLSVAELRAALTQDKASPARICQHYLEQIRLLEPELRAWVEVNESQVMADAERQTALPASELEKLPLAGIPIGIKDIIDIAGRRTRAGSSNRDNHIAEQDSVVVERLRAAGAILLGKTETTQFASLDPAPTFNPWDFACTPAGSSAGSAAAVAAGMCPVAIGTQTGGSINRPASYCGVVGFKPTFGTVSVEGVVPLAKNLDTIGAIGRTVDDVTRVWNVIRDRPSAPASLKEKTPPKLGLLHASLWHSYANDAMIRATDEAVRKAQAAGAKIVELPANIPLHEAFREHRLLMAHECAEYHRRDLAAHPEGYLPLIIGLMQEAKDVTPARYAQLLDYQRNFADQVNAWLAQVDALLMLATSTPAPRNRDMTGDSRFISVWSMARAPEVSLPASLDHEGLPCCVQLIGRHHDDDHLLQVAGWVEQQLGFTALPKIIQ